MDACGECGGAKTSALGAALPLCAVFGDLELDGRQLKDLAHFFALHGLPAQIACALRALQERHVDDDIGSRTGLEPLAWMSGLTAGLAPAGVAA
jgi:hypothetical protein